jgi:hypothetical protein
MRIILLVLALTLTQAIAPRPPEAEISSGSVRAKLYLPNAETGYYRGTRFDWSGAIASLEWKGHNYFGLWFEKYDPKLHDAITGPVEEFSTVGYDDVKAGESFVRIGVGAVRKPEEPAYRQFATYDITDAGTWTVNKGNDSIEFVHELRETAGYAYEYHKTVRLTGNTLVLEHRLKNAGRKPIATNVYNHNFYVLDGELTGPDFVVRVPFVPRAARPLNGLAEIRGKEVAFLKPFEPKQSVFTELEGFGATPADYDIRVENTKTGAGVRQTSDRPISKLNFWSATRTVCPEAFIDLRIDPGKESAWRITYEFYEVPKRQ